MAMMWARKVSRSTTAAARPGVGEGGAPFGERGVAGAGDGGFLLAGGDDLEQQFGAAGVEVDVAEFIDLCGYPHRSTYADTATMPTSVLSVLVSGVAGPNCSA